jgi:hypothetical protein
MPPWMIAAFGIVAAIAVTAGTFLHFYSKGEQAGAAKTTSAVQSKTIEKMDAARGAKEKADADVRATPYEGRVDGLK